jgi:hypothetical protein
MNNVYDSILKAADHIDRFPDEFLFCSTARPKGPGCGTPGCALGWIGTFSGYKHNRISFGAVAREVLQVPCEPLSDGDDEFYRRMEVLCGDDSWQRHAKECARVLRLYAVEYHSPAKHQFTGLPDIVREIFREQTEAAKD